MPSSFRLLSGRPRVVVHRVRSSKNTRLSDKTSRHIPKYIQDWVLKKLEASLQPVLSELDFLKKDLLEVKNIVFGKLPLSEDNLMNVETTDLPCLGKCPVSCGSGQVCLTTGRNYDHSNSNTVIWSSTIQCLIERSDEIDKTGFTQIKTRALLKAARCHQNLSPGVTLGPNATHSWCPSPSSEPSGSISMGQGLGGPMDLDITPIPKAKASRKKELKSVRLITEESTEQPIVDKDMFYQMRILADLNQLSLMEAQENMHLYLKQWEEHDGRVQELLAQRKAQQQAEDLARQQTKISEMARMQEEYIKRQQELDAAQANRDKEFYRRHEENKKQQMEVERLQREKNKKQAGLFQRIFDSFSSFSSKYREILEMFQKHEELKNSVACDLEVIKSCHEKFNSLIAKCKLDQITEEDVRIAEHLLNEVTAFNINARKEVENVEVLKKKEREEQEMLKKMEEEKVRRLQEDETRRRSQAGLSSPGDIVSPKSISHSQVEFRRDVVPHSKRYQEYLLLHKNCEAVERKLVEFSKNESLKKFRRDCEKAINIPLNAISAASASHLNDKYKKLSSFLQNQSVVITEKRISAASHPLGALYSMDYLALKTVKQGEQTVSSNPEAAYPIAAVVVALWTDLPDYGKLLLAQFYRASPYLIPAYWEQNESESDEEYYKRLGFKYTNNEQEEIDKFLKRQTGIMRLYCAIIVTRQNKANKSKRHPLPLDVAWMWLTAFIALPPKADISATVLLEMLEITGHLMITSYSAQFRKLLHLICISYLPLVEKVTLAGRGGPVTRLRGFLEGLISGKSILPPKGILSPNFW